MSEWKHHMVMGIICGSFVLIYLSIVISTSHPVTRSDGTAVSYFPTRAEFFETWNQTKLQLSFVTMQDEQISLLLQTLDTLKKYRRSIRTICEIGSGESTLLWLLSDTRHVVHSFDREVNQDVLAWIGYHHQDRWSVSIGDPVVTMKEYHRQHPDVQCDFVFIRGESTGYTPYIYVLGMKQLSHHSTILIMDQMEGTKAKLWERLLDEQKIRLLLPTRKYGPTCESFHCMATYT